MRMTFKLAAVAFGVCGVIAAPAALASAETPQELISRLQSQGYTVNIDRVGTAPIDQCVVTNVRNPQQVTQWVPYTGPGRGRDGDRVLVQVVTSQSISVSLNCSR